MNMTAAILSALRQHEAVTAREIHAITGVPLRTVQGAVAKLRGRGNPIRIIEWTHEQKAIRLHMVAVYALQEGKDAKRPAGMSNAQRCARWAKKQKRVASVFQLAA